MSEVSISVHFLGLSHEETRELLASVGVHGRIVATNERWTCVVPFEEDQVTEIALAAPDIALLWVYAADYALTLSFFQAQHPLGEVSIIWREELSDPRGVPASAELLDALAKRGALPLENTERFAELVRGKATAFEAREIRDQAAALFGLAAYEWLSPRGCLDTSVEAMRERFLDAEDVVEGDL